MQHNKGKPSFEGRSESIRMGRGERKIFEPACKQQATTAFQPHRTAAMDPLGWMSNLLWKRIVKSHVTWNGTGCLLTFSKTTKVSKTLLYRHGCLQDKSQLLDVLCLNIQRKQPSIWPLYQQWSGLPLSIRKGSTKLRRQGSTKLSMQATSSLVTRRRSYRALRPPPHMQKKRERGRSLARFILQGRTTVLLWHMRWRVWLGNIMEMYRTANPGMTVRPRPWPRGVASSAEL